MSPSPALPTPDVGSSSRTLTASYRKGELLRAGNQAFRLVKCLGLGAMGEVYEVDDQNLGVRRVMKLLRHELAQNMPHLVERFSRESRCLAKLRHPSCVSVILADRLPNGAPFYVMEFVAGRSLAAFMAKHAPLEPRVALPILLQVASALEAVHSAGIIHRDIKPDNVLVWREAEGIRATLLDFGVMKLVADHVLEGFCGTPKYAAPEQLCCEPITVKIDIFALGLVAFQMLTRREAYEDFDRPLERVKRPAPLLSDTGAAKGASNELVLLVADMLALDPKQRPTARQVADRLMACPEAHRDVATRSLREDEITNEELMSISPLHASPIHPADLDMHTMPGAPSMEVLEAARRALSPTVRGQTTPGMGLSDEIVFMVAETELAAGSPARAAGDAFDIEAHAMALARRVAMRAAATQSISPSGLPVPTDRLDAARPGVSELLGGISQQWKRVEPQAPSANEGSNTLASAKSPQAPNVAGSPRAPLVVPPAGPSGTVPMARGFSIDAKGNVQGGTLPMAAAFTQENLEPEPRPATGQSSRSQSSGTAAEAVRGAHEAVAAQKRNRALRFAVAGMLVGLLLAALLALAVVRSLR